MLAIEKFISIVDNINILQLFSVITRWIINLDNNKIAVLKLKLNIIGPYAYVHVYRTVR